MSKLLSRLSKSEILSFPESNIGNLLKIAHCLSDFLMNMGEIYSTPPPSETKLYIESLMLEQQWKSAILVYMVFETSCHTIRYAADKTGHKFAVKQTSQNSLWDEYDMMEKINCPFIMKAKGFEKKDGMNYLIMNLAEKEDLFISLCETGPKTEDVTRNKCFLFLQQRIISMQITYGIETSH